MLKAPWEQLVAAACFYWGGRGSGSGFGLELSSWLVLSHTHRGCSVELCLLVAPNACFLSDSVILKAGKASH